MMSEQESIDRRLPIGAEVLASGGVHFRVWAPKGDTVAVEFSDGRKFELNPEERGYFSGLDREATAGMLYKLLLPSGAFPDPVSRFQPEGVHGPSQIVDPRAFRWTDGDWRGIGREGLIIYEMHVGTFTREGTWVAAMLELPELAKLGVTTLELMPVSDFPGRFGWGYDGVDLFAPTRLYGTPDEFRAFVDRAHFLGLSVILDVVYNHLGPDGNYLREFSGDYFSRNHSSEWGDSLNFDCESCEPVREMILANAAYWIDEFHLDGLRLDATQQIFDDSDGHIISDIARTAREAARARSVFIVGENEPQFPSMVRPVNAGGHGLDAIWNDDMHHTCHVALTGHNEAYFTDYFGSPQELISAAKWGSLYQGQRYEWQDKGRGAPSFDLEPVNFVTCLENHDQIANSLRGARLSQLAQPGQLRAITAYLLLGPGTPMLFQGQEFGSTAPFKYFADHNAELAPLIREGRRKFLAQFPSISAPECREIVSAPEAEETFESCKLDHIQRLENASIHRLHADLIALRKSDPVFRKPRRRGVDGAVLGAEIFVLRYFGDEGDDRLLLVNLGRDFTLRPIPEPLLAPPPQHQWETRWTSESTIYGGGGMLPLESSVSWKMPGHAAVVMAPKRIG